MLYNPYFVFLPTGLSILFYLRPCQFLILARDRTNPCPCPFYEGSLQNNTSPQSAPRTQKRLHLIDVSDLCGEPAAREVAFSGEAPPRK
jgi:hypothetical protein